MAIDIPTFAIMGGTGCFWVEKTSHQGRAQAEQGSPSRDGGVGPACGADGQCHSGPGLPSIVSKPGFEFPSTGLPCHVPIAHIPGEFPPGAGVCLSAIPQPPPTTLQTLVSPGGPCPALPSSPEGGWSAGTPLAGTLLPRPWGAAGTG